MQAICWSKTAGRHMTLRHRTGNSVFHGVFHSVCGPTNTHYWEEEEGSVKYKGWYWKGNQHRLPGPAYIQYRKDGSVETEEWYWKGNRHRLPGPAYIQYRKDGSVEAEAWYLEGKRHHNAGPAIVYYREDGFVLWEEWFWEGKHVTKQNLGSQFKKDQNEEKQKDHKFLRI